MSFGMAWRAAKPATDGADRRRTEPSPGDAPGGAVGDAAIAEAALSPAAREALARIAAERDRLRNELTRARDRIASLERLADEDPLTLVANRRSFVRQLSRMIAFTQRYGVPASLVYFDINNMKQINDAHGHPAGDAALRHIAAVLHHNSRASDIVGRLGGDEFGVVLAQTTEARAHHKAAALAEAVARTPLRLGGAVIPVTAAYGVYAFAGTDDAQRAIEAADRAMYAQKRAAAQAAAEDG
jgi:diguanylate cyclase (GGDEF)-like protein